MLLKDDIIVADIRHKIAIFIPFFHISFPSRNNQKANSPTIIPVLNIKVIIGVEIERKEFIIFEILTE